MRSSAGVYVVRSVRKIETAERDTAKEQEIIPRVLPSEPCVSRKAVTAVRSQDIPSRDAETNDTNTERGKLGVMCDQTGPGCPKCDISRL